jgi:hypothetical protein
MEAMVVGFEPKYSKTWKKLVKEKIAAEGSATRH